MKQVLFFAVLFTFIVTTGCRSGSVSGKYICDASKRTGDRTIKREAYGETTLDFICLFQEFDFKGESTVTIKTNGGELNSSFVTDKDYIRIKGQGSDLLLKIKDKNTLEGEGIIQGTYHKN